MKVSVTHTDTFAGEANYGWVNSYDFELPDIATKRSIVYHAKKAAGMTGVKSDTYDYGDSITVRPRGYHQIIFVDFE